jgi:hypothetical protein
MASANAKSPEADTVASNASVDALPGFLTILDLTASSTIDSAEALREILARHDIASGEEIDVSTGVVKSLEDSRLIESETSERRRDDNVVSTSFVFVKARAERLDAAVIDIIRDVEAFPEVSFDLAMDAPTRGLSRELQNVQEAKLGATQQTEVASSVASPLRAAAGSSFIGSARRQKVMSEAARTNSMSMRGMTGDAANPVSYMLFVLRTTK